MTAVTHTVKFIRAAGRAYGNKWSYLAAFLAVFFVSFSTLAAFDIVPEAPEAEVVAEAPVKVSSDALAAAAFLSVPEDAVRIVIPAVDIDVSIKNPDTTDVATLDAALLSGAVRYPTSAKLGEEGNTILFGHSSYLPVVNNQAFKAFNEIQNLEEGDRITVYGETTVFVYSVTSVTSADADEDAIPLTDTGYTLTLATCDTFGKKSDRFIVESTLVESYPLAS